ncbi:hypothetical protein OB905_13210 [Halobacteria archaeon AArc-dxtr1]|nr:hypothetical protein [Halobacteria archaeon AArc-dxtr1]
MRGDREWYRYLGEGEFWDALFQPHIDTVGTAGLAMLIGVPLILSLYAWTGTFLIPAIILALFGGIMIMAAPPQLAIIGTLMVVTAVTISLLSVWGDT